jgi:cytochrome d ubiquinol oxidase subunit II
MGIVSLWVPFLGREIEARWFSWPNIAVLSPVPLLTAFAAWRLWRGIEDGRMYSPFLLSIALFLLGYLGLAISLFPYIVPPNVTVWQAANVPASQLFALVGFSIVMPLTFLYTGWAYWVFRGKVAEEITGGGYH